MRYQPFLNPVAGNTPVPRNAGVPFDCKKDSVFMPSFLAPRFKSLNGVWIYRLFRSSSSVPVDFFSMDYDCERWDGTPIPSSIAKGCSSACFIREFELDSSWQAGNILLHLDGSGPHTSVWVNGFFCGSVDQKESGAVDFDLTDTAQPGVNRIAIRTNLRKKDGAVPFGIFGHVSLILQPPAGLWNIRLTENGKKQHAAAVVRLNMEEKDIRLNLKLEIMDHDGKTVYRKMLVRDPSAEEQKFVSFHADMMLSDAVMQRENVVVFSLQSGRKLLDCRAIPLNLNQNDQENIPSYKDRYLPLYANSAMPKGPRRDPVSLEDDGESLWISATSGFMAEYSRMSGTLGSVDLDGISLLDQGPMPSIAAKLQDITLVRCKGDAEIDTAFCGVNTRWTISRSGIIHFDADHDALEKVKYWQMLIPRSLCGFFCDSSTGHVDLRRIKDEEISLNHVQKMVFTGIWRAGLAVFSDKPFDLILSVHRHHEEHCHCCDSHEPHEHHESLSVRIVPESAGKETELHLIFVPFASNLFDINRFLRSRQDVR